MVDEARPIQIAEHEPLPRFSLRGLDQPKLALEIFPGLTVVDQSIDPGPKLRIHRIGKFILPPKIKRQIGIKVRENNIRQQIDRESFQKKRELFRTDLLTSGATDVAMRADPRRDAVFFCRWICADHDRATGMVLRDL